MKPAMTSKFVINPQTCCSTQRALTEIVRLRLPPVSFCTEIVADTRSAKSRAPSCAAQCRARTTEMPPKKKKNKDDDWEAEAEALAAENDGTAPPSASAAAGDDDDDAGTKPAKKVCAS